MLPDFICIGAQKSATTWLYAQLRQHPQVFLPAIKELNFFYRDLAPDWYERHFQGSAAGQRRGDISPNYMVLPGVPERMHALVPGARLFCILREPVARARSQYQMAVKLGNIPAGTPFMEAFRDNLQYIRERGQYVDLLRRFERFYPADSRLKAFLYDDLVDDAAGFLGAIHGYIGVDRIGTAPNHQERVAAADAELALEAAAEQELREYYLPHVEALERYLGRPLPAWRQAPRP